MKEEAKEQEETFQMGKEVVSVLHKKGYQAYFAGGWVRDFLLERTSQDLDIATNATPDQIFSLFPGTQSIGKQFGVVMLPMETGYLEITTFRKEGSYMQGRYPGELEWSDAYEDAQRRDFTINGLFYDPFQDQVFDYVKGKRDLQRESICTIGPPQRRFEEDKLRLLRAVRFAASLQFTIEVSTLEEIKKQAFTLFPAVSMERVQRELLKMQKEGVLFQAVKLLFQTDLLKALFPQISHLVREDVENVFDRIKLFPKDLHFIFTLFVFFEDTSPQFRLSLCSYFRLPKWVSQEVKEYTRLEKFEREKRNFSFDWLILYAHSRFPSFLQAVLTLFPEEERVQRQEKHARQIKAYSHQIQDIQEKKKKLRAAHLEAEGISPGKQMGSLLKMGEEIAAVQQLYSPFEVIEELRKRKEL